MGCACNKQKTNGLAAKRDEAAATEKAKRDAEARQATSTRTLSQTGRTQSFAMASGGRTASFGSRLERDAAAARTGGRPV